jgi:hypothetical protein
MADIYKGAIIFERLYNIFIKKINWERIGYEFTF